MLLGKRPRPPMRRTTSMTLLGSDWSADGPVPEGSSPKERQRPSKDGPPPGGIIPPEGTAEGPVTAVDVPIQAGFVRSFARFTQGGSPRPGRKAGLVVMSETAHFLQECCLCKRRLGHGRDIYMYRGDSAFCSVECRQQQIVIDERKEKCSVRAMKKESVSASESQNSGSENVQTGTVAAG